MYVCMHVCGLLLWPNALRVSYRQCAWRPSPKWAGKWPGGTGCVTDGADACGPEETLHTYTHIYIQNIHTLIHTYIHTIGKGHGRGHDEPRRSHHLPFAGAGIVKRQSTQSVRYQCIHTYIHTYIHTKR
jgi:hypothetical protein